MSAAVAGAVQIVGGVLLAPALPGLVQAVKARLQGRRGASPLQPYRDLRRLWGKSSVSPAESTFVYRWAPAAAAASIGVCLLLVPVAGEAPQWPTGRDALLLLGLLALARFSVTLAAWDTGSGFALMGAARDLMIAVFAEALLIMALLVAVLAAGGTDLVAMSDAAAGADIWSRPAHWCGALAFALVVLVETGRQPIDSPDTHLELTMVHEGPLLEYAGRDLALLHWTAAARHWVMLVLAAELFAPHPEGFAARLALLPALVFALCVLLALVETAQAKLRLLRVPALLATGTLLALGGVISWTAGWTT